VVSDALAEFVRARVDTDCDDLTPVCPVCRGVRAGGVGGDNVGDDRPNERLGEILGLDFSLNEEKKDEGRDGRR
jgi:hypothetical protein